ncbi:MAG: sigma 54-interacting transcriptional regulator [Gammaproteobacteria bacterium]
MATVIGVPIDSAPRLRGGVGAILDGAPSGKRKLLYLKPDSILDEICWENFGGWDVHHVNSTAPVKSLIDQHEFNVGLVLFNKADIDQEQHLEEFLSLTHPMAKLAIVSPTCLQHAKFRKLLAENFYDYHTLPLDPARLLFTLGHAYEMARMIRALRADEECLALAHDDPIAAVGMIGASPIMQTFFHGLRKAAKVDAPVLLTGETGTGKELAALAIHKASTRANGPFVIVNCTTLPHSLIQSELFGYERGAFTGAYQRTIGQIESAHRGTIYLDEIGDLPFELQANLLRFLQEKTIRRIGNRRDICIDARVIAATHVNLEEAMAVGRFREDLYYRLNVLPLTAPPLRDRHGDIKPLVQFFFNRFPKEKNARIKGFSKEALQAMNEYAWPGNVRELLNRVTQAMAMSDNALITSADLGLENCVASCESMTLDDVRDNAEREAIEACLRRTNHRVSQAAKRLSVSRGTLYRLMEKHRIHLQSAE